MAIIENSGFKFLDGLGKEYIVIESSRIDEYIEFVKKNKIKEIFLSNLYYFDNNIDFLKRCNFVEKINITSSSIMDFSGLYSLNQLKALSLEAPKGLIDLSQFLLLTELSVEMNKNITGLNNLINLNILRLWKYKPRSKNLNELSSLTSITELKIYDSYIDSLEGCNKFANLNKLQLGYLNKLFYLNELEQIKDSLRILEIDTCKKIVNHDYVMCLNNLEELAFNNCNEIKSIYFIEQMPSLKRFVFMKTNIINGDISPCKKLEYVAFVDKKHYSHKNNELNMMRTEI